MTLNDWWSRPRTISVVVDTAGWFDPFAEQLVRDLCAAGDDAAFFRDASNVPEGAVAFYLSCMRLTPKDILDRNRLNLVVHASALPKGRGFSPIVWQILEGESTIPVTMIVAGDGPDTGDIVDGRAISFSGSELNAEIRSRLGECIVRMCLDVLAAPQPPHSRAQEGEPTWYRRRRPGDSRLDPAKTIAEQFDLLRVVDNDLYPAFFDLRGHRYRLRIEDMGATDDEGSSDAR